MSEPPRPATLRAAALAYDPLRDNAPRLVAKGEGIIAERIIARAREKNLPVHEDEQLLRFLMKVDLDERIPEALYIAVAQVLALVWQAESQAASPGQTNGSPPPLPASRPSSQQE